MSDPILEFFLRSGNTHFSRDFRSGLLINIVPMIFSGFVFGFILSSLYIYIASYMVLLLLIHRFQKSILSIGYYRYPLSKLVLCSAHILYVSMIAILISTNMDYEADEKLTLFSVAFFVLSIVIGINISYTTQYEAKEPRSKGSE